MQCNVDRTVGGGGEGLLRPGVGAEPTRHTTSHDNVDRTRDDTTARAPEPTGKHAQRLTQPAITTHAKHDSHALVPGISSFTHAAGARIRNVTGHA